MTSGGWDAQASTHLFEQFPQGSKHGSIAGHELRALAPEPGLPEGATMAPIIALLVVLAYVAATGIVCSLTCPKERR